MPNHARRLLPALLLLSVAATPPPTATGDRVLAAADLPGRAADLRDAGMPAGEVAQLLDVMQQHAVPPGSAAAVLRKAWDARRQGKPGTGQELVVRIRALLDRHLPPAALPDSMLPWLSRPIHRVGRDQ